MLHSISAFGKRCKSAADIFRIELKAGFWVLCFL